MLRSNNEAMIDDLKLSFIDRRNKHDSSMNREARTGSSPKEEPKDKSYLNKDLLSDDETDESPTTSSSPSYRIEHKQNATSVSPRTSSHRSRESALHEDDQPVHNFTTPQQNRSERAYQDARSAIEPFRKLTAPRPSLMYNNRLVIAIDFGTTYTGVAFARVSGDEADLKKDIVLVSTWGQGMSNGDKIPSVVSFSPCSSAKKERQFGFDLSENAVVMVNTKPELDIQPTKMDELESLLHALKGMGYLNFGQVEQCDGDALYSPKDPENIVTVYLTKVFEAFVAFLDNLFGIEVSKETRRDMATDLVITIPAAWSYKAKNSTFRAVTNAGFNISNFPKLSKTRLIKEPEAAAFYALRYLHETEVGYLAPEDTFVLCDAGGGTVDSITYLVTKIEPKLELQQIGSPSCKKCGASFVDANFKDWLRKTIGHSHWRTLSSNGGSGIRSHTVEGQALRAIMKEFDREKKAFGTHKLEYIVIRVPKSHPLFEATIGNVVVGGEIHVSRNEMKSFFEASINDIIESIEEQVEQAENDGRCVRNIVMIGGYAESAYLNSEIKRSMDLRGIELRRPETSWTAVVRGGVLSGIENAPSAILAKACFKSYGICLPEEVRTTAHHRRDVYADPTRVQAAAGGQMVWLIVKGDIILANETCRAEKEVVHTFFGHTAEELRLPVYTFERHGRLPQRFAPVARELTTVLVLALRRVAIPQLHVQTWCDDRGRRYWDVKVTYRLEYGFDGVLEASLLVNGDAIVRTKVKQ